ncbi:MAG: type 2 isopentenyl-diphosphate Delta-isomerase [Candidatus Dojkabacteria bacterium]|nr:type 2 isopentenyl-diphosphate Delta-isomerase [Candidatus Dojkabacteria bacterium]
MSQIQDRKKDHINIVLNKDVEPNDSSFTKYRLPYKSFPEIDFEKIDTTVDLFDKKLSFPFIISSMTGGEKLGTVINKNIAIAAEKAGVAFGLGSMRVILRKPESLKTFNVRKDCPTIPMYANFGVVQLNYGYGADDINKIIDLVEADGIFLHVNPIQEIIQPEGDKNWEGLLLKLSKIIPKIKGNVILKETGHGIDFASAKKLAEMGVKWIDVSGSGGTSWANVEAYRRIDDIGHLFKAEGIPTDELLKSHSKIKGLNLIAGGGIRNGKDVAKSIALGAKIATAAKPLLADALKSDEKFLRHYKN